MVSQSQAAFQGLAGLELLGDTPIDAAKTSVSSRPLTFYNSSSKRHCSAEEKVV